MPRKPPSLIAPKAQAVVDAGPPKEPIHTGKDGKQLRIGRGGGLADGFRVAAASLD